MENRVSEKQISEIHLIRHGKTEGTQKRWFYGALDIPLSNEGVDELAAQAKEGIYPCMDLPAESAADFYTSGMLRAEQTFFLIYGAAAHKAITDLREIDFGEFEGRTHDELKDTPKYKAWLDMKGEDAAPPGGESIAQFSERVDRGFDTLCGYHRLKELSHRHSRLPAHSVIVCHGGVIGGLMHKMFYDPNKNLYDWIPAPGHGYTLVMENGKAVEYRRF